MQLGTCERDAWVGVLLTAVAAVALVVAGLGAVTAPAAADETENVSMYTTDRPGFDDADGVERAIADGTLEEADELVVGATIVVAVDSGRLASDLEARNGSATERFFAALEDDAVLHLVQTNPTTMRPAKAIRLGPDTTTVHRSGNTTYVSVRTGDVEPSWDPRQDDSVSDPRLRGGERFAVRYGHANRSVETSDAVVEVWEAEAELYGVYDPLAPELVNRSVAVRVDPDEEVLVRVTLDDGSTRTAEPEPVPWSGFRGFTVDLRDVDPGTGYTLEVVHDGEAVDRRNGTVREPAATLADPTVSPADGDDYAARLNLTAALTHGGTVVVTDGDGDRVGIGNVPPGAETDLSIGLRHDADAAAEFGATELEIRAVRDTATGTRPYPGPETTTTIAVDDPAWTSTDAPTSPTGTAPDTGGEGGPTDDQGPGFGVASLAAAVAGFGLLLRRRVAGGGDR